MSLVGSDPDVAVSDHARDRYAQRVLGEREGIGPFMARDEFDSYAEVDEEISDHFEESLPCSLVTDRKQHSDRKARIHPEDYVVWLFVDGWDDSTHAYQRNLVTCYPYVPSRRNCLMLGQLTMCGFCDRLYYPPECNECGCGVEVGSPADRAVGRWYDTSKSFSIEDFVEGRVVEKFGL